MPRTAKPPVALPPEARERLLTLIAQSSEPLSAKNWAAGLSEFFKATDKQVAPLLTELVATGALHEFAPLKGKALVPSARIVPLLTSEPEILRCPPVPGAEVISPPGPLIKVRPKGTTI